MEKQERDWSSLPADIIEELGKLLPLPHRLLMRSICTSWRSAISPFPSPWLLLPGEDSEVGEYNYDSCTFMSVPMKPRTFSFPLPSEVRGMHCVGSHNGWLALCDLNLNLLLLNPLTSVQISLPPFTNHPKVIAVYEDRGGSALSGLYNPSFPSHVRTPKDYRNGCFINKIVFSSPTVENFTVAAMYGTGKVVYTVAGGTKWNLFEQSSIVHNHVMEEEKFDILDYQIEDIEYNDIDGKFYAITLDSAQVIAFDLNGTSPKVTLVSRSLYSDDPDEYLNERVTYVDVSLGHKYLAFLDHRLFMLLRLPGRIDDIDRDPTRKFVVMTFNSESFCWDVVHDLGDYSFFIGTNNSFCLRSKGSHQLRNNFIYYADILVCRGLNTDTGLFDVEKQNFEQLYADDSDLNWQKPSPIWFMPSWRHCRNIGTRTSENSSQNGTH